MQGLLIKLTWIIGAVLLTLESAQTKGFAQQVDQVNPETTVSNILADTDSDSAAQLTAPDNTSDDSLSVSLEDALPVISAPERHHEEVIDSLSVDQVPFKEGDRSLTIIDIP